MEEFDVRDYRESGGKGHDTAGRAGGVVSGDVRREPATLVTRRGGDHAQRRGTEAASPVRRLAEGPGRAVLLASGRSACSGPHSAVWRCTEGLPGSAHRSTAFRLSATAREPPGAGAGPRPASRGPARAQPASPGRRRARTCRPAQRTSPGRLPCPAKGPLEPTPAQRPHPPPRLSAAARAPSPAVPARPGCGAAAGTRSPGPRPPRRGPPLPRPPWRSRGPGPGGRARTA